MTKFQNLTEAFWYIRENPLEYFPEKSLSLFQHFWWGYQWRHEVEFKESEDFSLLEGLYEFVCEKYKVPSNRSSYNVALFYSQNDADAFDFWFDCVNEFALEKKANSHLNNFYHEKSKDHKKMFAQSRNVDFFTFLKAILERPEMYVGSKSFTFIISLISGWIRVTEDFDLQQNEQEKTFKNFQKYIEERPIGLRANGYSNLPPIPAWNKIIWFWSSLVPDEEKSLEMFAKYFDEFAFQGKGYVKDIEVKWKKDVEHQKDCHIIKRWKNS